MQNKIRECTDYNNFGGIGKDFMQEEMQDEKSKDDMWHNA